MTKTKPTKIPKRKLLVPEEADHVVIFTDGACLGNPGPGGYGAILRFKGKERRVSGGEEETTNNRMELMAVIKALESLKRDHPVICLLRQRVRGQGHVRVASRLEAGVGGRQTGSPSRTGICGSDWTRWPRSTT